jgi:hypothetical protein
VATVSDIVFRHVWSYRVSCLVVEAYLMDDIEYVVFPVFDGIPRKFPNKETAKEFVDMHEKLQIGNFLMVTILEWDIIMVDVNNALVQEE